MYIQCFQGEPKRDGVLVPEIRGDMGAESIYSTPSQRLVDNPDGQTHGSRPGSERAPRSAAGISQAAEPSQLHSSLPTPVHLALNFQSPSGVSSGTINATLGAVPGHASGRRGAYSDLHPSAYTTLALISSPLTRELKLNFILLGGHTQAQVLPSTARQPLGLISYCKARAQMLPEKIIFCPWPTRSKAFFLSAVEPAVFLRTPCRAELNVL